MPITWNAENESKLMANIFLVCDIKVSQAELKQVAERMGNGTCSSLKIPLHN